MTNRVDRLRELVSGEIAGVDGIIRPRAEELELNLILARTFRGEDGEKALAYLKSITIHFVQGPRVTDEELRHIEGQRFIVGVIDQRIQNGRNRKPTVDPGQRGRRKPTAGPA